MRQTDSLTPVAASPSPVLADILPPERNNFAAIRLAMALAVLVSHSWWLATGQSSLEPLHAWTHHTLGEHAVQVFFFLSGVVVAQSLFKSGSLIDFAAARALRIFPALVACVLMTALILGPLVTTGSFKAYFADRAWLDYIAKTIALTTGSAPLPGVFTDVPVKGLVNLSLWTLKFEVLCYALLAAFGLILLRRPQWLGLMTAGLAVFVACIFVGMPKTPAGYSALDNVRYFILFFGMGTLAFLMRNRLPLTWVAVPPLFAIFALAIGTRFAELTSAIFLGYATLMIASLSLPRLRSFTNLQDYSFGVYIIACPVQQALIHLRPGIGPIELTLVTLGIVLPLSVFSWTHIERPAMQLRKRLVASIRRRAGLSPAILREASARVDAAGIPAFASLRRASATLPAASRPAARTPAPKPTLPPPAYRTSTVSAPNALFTLLQQRRYKAITRPYASTARASADGPH